MAMSPLLLLLAVLLVPSAVFAVDPKSKVSRRSCELEAVFKTPDGTYFAVERSVQHRAHEGDQEWQSHVASWSKWSNGFPVVDQNHDSLKSSEEVFPRGYSYVNGGTMDNEGRVAIAVDYGKEMATKSPIPDTQNIIHLYNYNNGSFSYLKSERTIEYFSYLPAVLKEHDVYFNRLLSMTYIDGPEEKYREYVVVVWTTKNGYMPDVMSARTFLQSWVTHNRTKATRTKQIVARAITEYIPNLSHVKELSAENYRVIEGAYGVWKHSEYPRASNAAWQPELSGLWHMDDPLMGCPQVLCFDADVDAITETPEGGILIFRGCYFWTAPKASESMTKEGRSPELTEAEMIKDTWKTLPCNLMAAFFMPPDTLYVFKEGYFYKCSFGSKTCGDSEAIRNLFPGMEHVSAATRAPNGDIWLMDGSEPLKYAVYKLGGSGKGEEVVKLTHVQPKFPFLPKFVDDMYTQDGSIIFMTQSHHFTVKESKIENSEFDRDSVHPQHTPGYVFACSAGDYGAMQSLGVNNVNKYWNWREPPPPAPPVVQPEPEKKSTFNWLWLLLLLLLLIPLCCLIPCRKPRDQENPKAPPESLFARSALGSALSALKPDDDLRSNISSAKSNLPPSTFLNSRGPSRSGFSDASSGRPGAGGAGNPSSGSRSGMSNPSGGSPSAESRSGMSSPSGGRGAPGSRSGMSSPSGGGAPSGSRSGMSSPSSGKAPSGTRSGMGGPSGGPASANSRSGMSSPSGGQAPSASRSGMSSPSGGQAPAGSRSGLSNASGKNPSSPSRSGMSSPSGPNSSSPSRSGMSNPSGTPKPTGRPSAGTLSSASRRSGMSAGSSRPPV